MSSTYRVHPSVKVRWTKTPTDEKILLLCRVSQKQFTINRKTLTLLQLCDSTRTRNQIVHDFLELSPETTKESITAIFDMLLERDLITESESAISESPFCCVHLEHAIEAVTVEITNRCNLSCVHCYNDSGPHENEFTEGQIETIISSLDAVNVGHIVFSGGEPLLHPHFFDAVTMVQERGMSWNIFSNATLINEVMAKTLVDAGIVKLTTSLDGASPEPHDLIRGKGTFKKTVHAITLMQEYNIPVKVHTVLHKKNLKEIPDLIRLFHSLGVNQYRLGLMRYARPGTTSDLVITFQDYYDILPDIVETEYELYGESQVIPTPNPDCRNCGTGISFFMIKSDGSMVPCPQGDPHFFTFGNALTDDIQEKWNTADILRNLRTYNFKSNEQCRTCPYQLHCDGGCPIVKYELYGDAFVLDPNTCEFLKSVKPFLQLKE